MMGASAIYVGFVYNDCFSLCLALFDSGYRWDGAENGLSGKVGGGIAANTTAPYGTQAVFIRLVSILSGMYLKMSCFSSTQ